MNGNQQTSHHRFVQSLGTTGSECTHEALIQNFEHNNGHYYYPVRSLPLLTGLDDWIVDAVGVHSGIDSILYGAAEMQIGGGVLSLRAAQ